MYDRLQSVGVCLSYGRSLAIVDEIGQDFNRYILKLIESGKRFRIVGDNINWMAKVGEMRMDNRPKMEHAFGSAVIVQNLTFVHLDNLAPINNYANMEV